MKLKLTVDGKVYEVDVEVAESKQPRPGYIPPLDRSQIPTSSGAAGSKLEQPEEVVDESKACRSPISGVVVSVLAQPGQEIKVGDLLLVIEAMKMETQITAPTSGKVARIHVNVGDAVQPKQVLVEIE